MLKTLTIMVFLCLPGVSHSALTDSLPPASSQLVSVVLHKSFGVFDKSHAVGLGAEYAIAPGRFGLDNVSPRRLGWIAKAGVDYFVGRADATEGYSFRYSNYLYAQLMGGVIYNPVTFASLFVVAGPGIGIYSGSASVGINAAVAGNVFVDRRVSVGPVLTFRKHREADALWTAGIRVGLVLP